MKLWLFLVVVVAAVAAADNAEYYTGHKLVTAHVRTAADAELLEAVSADVWTGDGRAFVGRNATFAVSAAAFARVAAAGLPHVVIAHDLAAHIRSVESRRSPRDAAKAPLNDEWFATWHGYADIQEKLHALSVAFPNATEFLPQLGTSFEGRAISGIRVGSGARAVMFLSGTHAREWIAEAVTLWFIGAALEEFKAGNDPFPDVSVYVVPCYNPDGYEFSRTTQRYWRKNRRQNDDGSVGVDTNRNWDVDWCNTGGSKTPSSDIYCGKGPFSESETKAMSEFVKKIAPTSLIDFHSHAALLLRPFGYKYDVAPDEDAMKALGEKMKAAIKAVHGTNYVSERSVDLYPCSGATDDWSKESGNVRFVQTIELDGADFVVPTSDIAKQGSEMYPALKIFANAAVV